MPITHATTTVIADNPAYDVSADEWNAAHVGTITDPTIPAGGTLYDGTSTTDWTAFGSQDAFDADTTVPGAFYIAKTTMGTGNLVGAYHAVGGSFPRTYTMKLLGAHQWANYQSPGILIAEAAPGKFETFAPVMDTGQNYSPYLQRYGWTNASSAGGSANYATTHAVFTPLWLRITVTSSTSIAFAVSRDGYLYYTLESAFNPSFTIGAFGFGMSSFAAVPMAMAVDWIHET